MSFTIDRPPTWEEVPKGKVPALMRVGRKNNNALQLSINWNTTGRKLEPPTHPVAWAQTFAEKMGGYDVTTSAGACGIGQYGRAVFKHNDLAHGEMWIVSDDVHMFVATFSCDAPPTAEELAEVSAMVRSVRWPRS